MEQIHRLDESSGGFGGLMIQATEWGTREQVKHSYELIARYVMPQFQGSLVSLRNSQKQSADLKDELNVLKTRSLEQAAKDYEAQRVSD